MKKTNQNLIWYLGLGIALGLILLLFLTDFPKAVDAAIGLVAVVIMSASYVQLRFHKWMQDGDFKREVMDERNILIKEKAGFVANMAMMALLGCATALFLALDYTVPAIVTCVICACNPIIMILASNQIEKKL